MMSIQRRQQAARAEWVDLCTLRRHHQLCFLLNRFIESNEEERERRARVFHGFMLGAEQKLFLSLILIHQDPDN
jgi:hypothetical protein